MPPSGATLAAEPTEPAGPAAHASGPGPRAAVRAELRRALLELALLPWHAGRYLAQRGRLRAELASDLEREPRAPEERVLGALPRRELSIFVSCAERSGETHAVSFVRALRTQMQALGLPAPRLAGLGGERLAAEGVELLGRPVDQAVMGLEGVMRSLSYYTRLLETCAQRFRSAPPDVLVPVDSPALHVPLARIARRYGVPSVHFIAPQHWGWAPWRTRGYATAMQRALTILPFEAGWLERRGVRAVHVGHPLLDHLEGVPGSRPIEGSRVIALLAGSRASVIERNLPWMLDVARRAQAQLGSVPWVVLHDDEGQRARLEALIAQHGAGLDLRLSIGALHAELAQARAALSVSGTVLLDLLHHRLPCVVVYRLGSWREAAIGRRFVTAPWFSVTNLLAGRELLPEFGFAGEGPREEVAAALVRAHADRAWRAQCLAGLDLAARRLGPAGAARRAVREALDVASAGRISPRTP